MAVGYNPRIVTDGLLLSFDAGNSKSVYTSVPKRFYGLGGGENNYLGISSTGVAHSTSGYYDLDGSTGYLSTTLPLDRSTYPDFTVEAWINADSLGFSNVIMARGDGGQGGFDFKFDLYDLGYPRGTVYTDSSSNVESVSSSAGVISTGSWYHCAISFSNGSYIKTYVNGIDLTHPNYTYNTYNRNTGNSSLPLVVGRSDTGSNYFNGKISGLRYYTRELSADELLSNYRAFDRRNFSQTITFAATPRWNYPVAGQVVFTSFNTALDTDVSWTVPDNVTEISAVCVGGGGGGGGCNNGTDGNGSGGGGGGALAYGTFAVTPGETLTIRVGSGGTGAPGSPATPIQVADPGGNTYIKRSTTTLLQGGGGGGGSSNLSAGGNGSGGLVVEPKEMVVDLVDPAERQLIIELVPVVVVLGDILVVVQLVQRVLFRADLLFMVLMEMVVVEQVEMLLEERIQKMQRQMVVEWDYMVKELAVLELLIKQDLQILALLLVMVE